MGLEDGLPPGLSTHGIPRATLIAAPGTLPGLRTAVWMGGAHSLSGDEMVAEAMANAWIIDAAGELPEAVRASAALWVPCVFPDIDASPARVERIHAVVAKVAAAMRGDDAPGAVYTVCQHGMNRSGLFAGLLLREMGMGGEDVVELIRKRRPGALSNLTFVQMIRG
jgi:hypothetical protein